MTAQLATFETKSNLAKLLATENITMQHNPASPTAYFDIKSRVLTLPVWKNISEDLYDLLVVHEVGHALDTNMDNWLEGINKLSKKFHGDKPTDKQLAVMKGYFNVIEDVRIDKRQKRRYPGSRKNYIKGYAELMERDFMGIKGQDVNSLPFIDRVNVYFKGGYTLGIKFTNEEKRLMKLMEDAETFDDVTKIVDAVYTYAKDTEKNKEKNETPEDDFPEYEEDEDGDYEMEFDTEGDEDEESEGDSGAESDQEESDEGEEKQKNKSTKNNEDKEEESDSKSNTDASGSGSQEKDEDIAPESLTEKNERKNAENLAEVGNVEFVYVDVPKIDVSAVIDSYKVVLPSMTKLMNATTYYFTEEHRKKKLEEFKSWKLKEKDAISFMIQEFESKKAADTYARTSIAKTGVLDTNKAFSYKYNDDLFRKLTVVTEGKNHGFVLFMDWSGSMSLNLTHTLKQLFSLCMFCKKVQIPFEVYLFRDWAGADGEMLSGRDKNGRIIGGYSRKSFYQNTSDSYFVLRPFKLRNILSSRMNISDMNRMMESLWLSAFVPNREDNRHGTPLNEAIMAADYVINDFKKKNRIQIVSTIFLTDGGADYAQIHNNSTEPYVYGVVRKRKQTIINDRMTKKSYFLSSSNQYELTATFLKIMKDRTGCKTVGFYIAHPNLKYLQSMVYETVLNSESVRNSWKEDGYFATKQSGYDEYFIMNVAKLANKQANELNVDSNMSNNRLAREFMKYSSKKRVNRAMLSKFISLIAVE